MGVIPKLVGSVEGRSVPFLHELIRRKTGRADLQAGETVWLPVDLLMMHDSSGPRRIADDVELLGGAAWNADQVMLVSDHFVPGNTRDGAQILATTAEWASQKGIRSHFIAEGISHILILERGLAMPGTVLVGGDSHTSTAGSAGLLAIGVGSTDLAATFATGETWFKVPEVIRVRISGRLPDDTSLKDLMLRVIGDRGMDGALGHAVEFQISGGAGGDVVERSVITNMTAELAAVTSVVPPDGALRDYSKRHGIEYDDWLDDWQWPPDSAYRDVWEYGLEDLEPMVAMPGSVSNVHPISGMGKQPIDRAYIGACTGAKRDDLREAAAVLKDKSIAPGVRLLVAPASKSVFESCVEDGTLLTLVQAGVEIQPIGCGACLGFGNGVLADGERCIASTNRNFAGRMGSELASIYLASPATVAASAVAGEICSSGAL